MFTLKILKKGKGGLKEVNSRRPKLLQGYNAGWAI